MVAALRMTRALWAAAALLAGGAVYEGVRTRDVLDFNAAVRRDDLAAAAAHDHPNGAFAAARAAQRAGDFDGARRAYEAVPTTDPALRTALRFNLANAYLRRAFELGDAAGADVVGPLIELAKQQYREVLRTESAAWDARYNLELALSVQPDLADVEAADEAMPEHSRQAIATQRKFVRLP